MRAMRAGQRVAAETLTAKKKADSGHKGGNVGGCIECVYMYGRND